jgi:hypothetical protein
MMLIWCPEHGKTIIGVSEGIDFDAPHEASPPPRSFAWSLAGAGGLARNDPQEPWSLPTLGEKMRL